MKLRSIYWYLIFGCTALVFAALSFLTPLIHDDFAFLFKYGPKADVRPTAERVKNVADVLESQYYFYQTVNGRFTTHFLLQLVLMMGKNIFNILNDFAFAGLILLIYRFSKNTLSYAKLPNLLLFVIFSIWFLLPFFGQTMLWGAGAVNYLWSSCFVLLFLYRFRKEEQNKEKATPMKLLSFFVLSFLAGNTNEAITFGVSAALFFYFISTFKKLTPILLAMIAGFGLGTLAIIFSQGTISRANNDVVTYSSAISLISQKTVELVGILYNLKFSLLVSLVLLIYLMVKKTNIISIILSEKMIVLSVLFNGLLLLAIGNIEVRMLYGVTVLITVFNATLFSECLKFLTSVKLLTISVLMICFLSFGFYSGLHQVNDYRQKNIIFTNQLQNKTQKVFYFPDFEDSRFVYHTVGDIRDSKNYHNRVKSFYYGLAEINVLPDKLYQEIYGSANLLNENNWNNQWSKQTLFLSKDHYSIIRLPVKFQYREGLEAKLVFSGGEEKLIPLAVMPIKEHYYAFFDADYPVFDSAVSITVVSKSGATVQKIEKSVESKTFSEPINNLK